MRRCPVSAPRTRLRRTWSSRCFCLVHASAPRRRDSRRTEPATRGLAAEPGEDLILHTQSALGGRTASSLPGLRSSLRRDAADPLAWRCGHQSQMRSRLRHARVSLGHWTSTPRRARGTSQGLHHAQNPPMRSPSLSRHTDRCRRHVRSALGSPHLGRLLRRERLLRSGPLDVRHRPVSPVRTPRTESQTSGA